MINVFQPTVGKDELAAIQYAFSTNWLGRGPMCELLESALAAHFGVPEGEVLLFNSCTSAMYVMMQALGIGPGDNVLLPSIHFIGAYNAVVDCGATPVLMDVDPHTLNVYPYGFRRFGDDEKDRAIFPLHYGGHLAPTHKIMPHQEALLLIEDAACAPCSKLFEVSAGTLGDGGVWSFDAMKPMTMGDGGALWLRDPDARKMARALRYLGLKPGETSGAEQAGERENWWEYEPVTTSGRYISNDIAAAIGLEQLEKLPSFIERRSQIWERYDYFFQGFNLIPRVRTPPTPPGKTTSSYAFYWIQLEERDALAHYLFERDIYTTFRYWPLHRACKMGKDADFPGAAEAADTTLLLPCHQGLSEDDIGIVIQAIKEFFD